MLVTTGLALVVFFTLGHLALDRRTSSGSRQLLVASYRTPSVTSSDQPSRPPPRSSPMLRPKGERTRNND